MRALDDLLSNANFDPVTDAKTRKVLVKYSPLASDPIGPEQEALLKKERLYLGKHVIDHDDAVLQALAVARQADKRTLAGLFLASLSTGLAEFRGGLPAFAILTKMPAHSFQKTPADNCQICCCTRRREADLTFFNSIRVSIGALMGTDVYMLWFNISMAQKTSVRAPIQADLEILHNLLRAIRAVPQNTKPVALIRDVKRAFPYRLSTEQARTLLDMLGVLSILEPPKHKGFLNRYTNLGLAPRKSGSSDWAYPMDWWTGADGVNAAAVDHWFGDWLG